MVARLVLIASLVLLVAAPPVALAEIEPAQLVLAPADDGPSPFADDAVLAPLADEVIPPSADAVRPPSVGQAVPSGPPRARIFRPPRPPRLPVA